VLAGDQDRPHSVIGEECHIVSPRPTGPRGGESVGSGSDLDGYDNLILLCPTDHSLVDQAVLEYPVKRLLWMKAAHEAWWKESLETSAPGSVKVRRGASSMLSEVTDARELMSIVVGAHESSLDHDDLTTEEEVNEVGVLLQSIFDYSEIWEDLEPARRVQATFDLGRDLAAARANGWRVFATRAHGAITGGAEGQPSRWDTAYVRVVRSDSSEIVNLTDTSVDSSIISTSAIKTISSIHANGPDALRSDHRRRQAL